VAAPAPTEAAAPANAAQRKEAERAPVDKAQPGESTPPVGAATNAVTAATPKTTARADSPSRSGSEVAATPLSHLLATIGADPARWSRQTAAGQTVALDAAWRAWLSELDAASVGRWRRLDGVGAAFAEADASRDGADSATTLRLVSDGRLAAVLRVDAGIVQLDAAPGTRSERWQAALGPADAARLRTTSRRLPP